MTYTITERSLFYSSVTKMFFNFIGLSMTYIVL